MRQNRIYTVSVCAAIVAISAALPTLFARVERVARAEASGATAAEAAARRALKRLGITPESLIFAGVEQEDAQQMLRQTTVYLEEHSDPSVLDEVCRQLTRECEHLEEGCRQGHGQAEARMALRQARLRLTMVKAERASALRALFDAATQGLSDTQRWELRKGLGSEVDTSEISTRPR